VWRAVCLPVSLSQRFLGRYEFKVGGGQTCEQESEKTIVLLAQVLLLLLLLLLRLQRWYASASAQDTSDGGKPVAFKFFRDEAQVPTVPMTMMRALTCLLLSLHRPF
jgi:hypothetical protein